MKERLSRQPVREMVCALWLVLVLAAGLILGPGLGSAQTSPQRPTDPRKQVVGKPAPVQPPAPTKDREQPVFERSSAGGVPDGAVIDSVYIVGPGDRLVLGIWGVDPQQTELQVDLEGNLLLPQLGALSVAGLPLSRVKERLTSRMRQIYPRAEITLSLTSAREFRVFLAGNVANPGSYRVSAVDRVADLVDRAGTANPNASFRNVQLKRRDGTGATVDLQRFYLGGDLKDNPILRDGDVVVVPFVGAQVELYGAVHTPGIFEHLEGERLSDLLTVAGGLNVEALPDSICLVRFGADGLSTTTRYFNYPAENPELQSRDQIFVRPRPDWHAGPTVELKGEFQYPMLLPIVEGTTRVSDAIAAGGGFTEDAAVNEATLTRTGDPEQLKDLEYERLKLVPIADMSRTEYEYFKMKQREKQGKMEVDFRSVLADPGRPDNILLKRGDVLYTPMSRKFVQVSGQVGNPGNIQHDSNLTVPDYIERAGGYSWNARKSRTTLIRGRTGEWVRDPSDSLHPEPGDVIWVPEKPEPNLWVLFKDGMMVASQAATVYLLIQQVTK
jgi:polysaccharide biosynthesis/export protein